MHARNRGCLPDDLARIGQRKRVILGGCNRQGTRAQGFAGGLFNRAARRPGGCALEPGVALNTQTIETAHIFTRHHQVTIGLNFGCHRFAALQTPHQGRRIFVDKLPHEFHVQRIRKAVFHRPAALLPMLGIFQPIIAVGDISPCANMCQPCRQRVEVALNSVATRNLFVHPRRRYDAGFVSQKGENLADQPAMLARHSLAEIRNLGDRP